MSTKRNSAVSDEQTHDFVLQREDNTKHAKLTSSNDTTLQDLPIEMLERILVQAVVMEVKDMKMAKCVWKEKAGLVIIRLTDVCSQWSSILTTDYFRNEVNRVIDGTDQEACRLEILQQYPLPFKVSKVATNKEEIFLLCTHAQGDLDRVINVYNRNNLAEVKDVILLPRRNAKAIEACMVSDCLYVLFTDSPGILMFRLTRNEQHHQFNISPWISDYKLSYADLSVSANGNVVITSDRRCSSDVLISIYDANGFFQHKVELLPHVYDFQRVDSVMQKSDGNLVVVYANEKRERRLMEIDTSGRILRQYQPPVVGLSILWFTDNYDRILMMKATRNTTQLVDCEFNPMEFAGLPLDEHEYIGHLRLFDSERLPYNRTRNEIVDVVYGRKFKNGVLTFFRLT